MDKKPDKYEMTATEIAAIDTDTPSFSIYIKRIEHVLRRAFPSAPSIAESAEDAALCSHHIVDTLHIIDGIPTWTIEDQAKAIAELEAFASARTAPWRNVVNDILAAVSWHRIPPTVLEQARKLLSTPPQRRERNERHG